MKIADLEHLESVTKPNQSIQGGLINFPFFAFARAEGSKSAWTWATTYTVTIAL